MKITFCFEQVHNFRLSRRINVCNILAGCCAVWHLCADFRALLGRLCSHENTQWQPNTCTRTCMYTSYTFIRNDPRLMRETPEIMAISNALERPVGQYAARCVVCIGAFAGTILSVARYSQTATNIACVAFVCMCVVVELAVFKCGMSLLRTINKSVRRNSSTAGSTSTMTLAAGQEDQGKGERLDDRLAARKKIVMATSICLGLGGGTIAILMFSVSSPFGMFTPLLFFATPMVYA